MCHILASSAPLWGGSSPPGFLVSLPAGKPVIAQNIVDLRPGQVKHIGFDLLGKIEVRTVGKEAFRLLVDFQIALPPPGPVGFGRRAIGDPVMVEVPPF